MEIYQWPSLILTHTGIHIYVHFKIGCLINKIHFLLNSIFLSGRNLSTGLWLIFGIIAFLCIEKVFNQSFNNQDKKSKKITGYLNLLANCIDNFIHGLAVASSFLTSLKLGMTTVFAILVHEIPHEVGDFVILMNSGFTR
jgi:zinc transporter ZupT